MAAGAGVVEAEVRMVKAAVGLALQVALIVVFFVALMILVARVAGAAEPQNSCPPGVYWSSGGDSACIPAAGVQSPPACAPGMYWSSRAGVCVLLAQASAPPTQTSVLFTEKQTRTTAVLKEIAALLKRGYRCQWAKTRQYQCDPPEAPQPGTPTPAVQTRCGPGTYFDYGTDDVCHPVSQTQTPPTFGEGRGD
jgi:hypothetical protein